MATPARAGTPPSSRYPPNIQVRGHHPNTTNNQMEMTAVIEGLTRLGQFIGIDGVYIEVRTDSEYICNGFNKGWLTKWQQNDWLTSGKKAVANQDLWEELLRLTQGPHVTFTHVQGHAGDPMNRLCDRIANEEALKAERKRFKGRDSNRKRWIGEKRGTGGPRQNHRKIIPRGPGQKPRGPGQKPRGQRESGHQRIHPGLCRRL